MNKKGKDPQGEAENRTEKQGAPPKQKKLATRLSIAILIGLLVVFSILITVVAITTKSDLVERQEEKLTLLAKNNATVALRFMQTMVDKQQTLAIAVSNMRVLDPEERPGYLKRILAHMKMTEPNILSLYFVAEPNTALAPSPTGFSMFATEQGVMDSSNRFAYIDEAAYTKAKSTKSMTIVDPLSKTIDGKEYTVLTVFLPVLDDAGELLGAVGCNIDIKLLSDAAYDDGGFESFYNQIICGHQTVIIDGNAPENVGKPYLDVSASKNAQKIVDSVKDESSYTFLDESTDGSKSYRAFTPFTVGSSTVSWLSGSTISKEEFDQTIMNQIVFLVIIAMVCLVVLILVCYVWIKRMLRPIIKIEHAAKEMAKGNLGTIIQVESNDELGSLANSLQESMRIIQGYVLDIDRAMSCMAGGNFDLQASDPFIGDFSHIEESISAFIFKMSQTLYTINNGADSVSESSKLVSDGAQALAQGSAEQASSVEELSARATEIRLQVSENAQSSTQAKAMSDQATLAIQSSNQHMQRLMVAMTEINQKSNQISKIIKTIEDIAFQTNILALNAAVEAARAGAAGKGFAVVADEVRNLASKSAEAAKNTTQLITDSIQSVETGTKLANEAAAELMGIVGTAEQTASLISQVTASSNSQALAIAEMNAGIEQIASVVQTSAATAEESAAASEELSSQSAVMKEMVNRFVIKKGLDYK